MISFEIVFSGQLQKFTSCILEKHFCSWFLRYQNRRYCILIPIVKVLAILIIIFMIFWNLFVFPVEYPSVYIEDCSFGNTSEIPFFNLSSLLFFVVLFIFAANFVHIVFCNQENLIFLTEIYL